MFTFDEFGIVEKKIINQLFTRRVSYMLYAVVSFLNVPFKILLILVLTPFLQLNTEIE